MIQIYLSKLFRKQQQSTIYAQYKQKLDTTYPNVQNDINITQTLKLPDKFLPKLNSWDAHYRKEHSFRLRLQIQKLPTRSITAKYKNSASKTILCARCHDKLEIPEHLLLWSKNLTAQNLADLLRRRLTERIEFLTDSVKLNEEDQPAIITAYQKLTNIDKFL
ncbi:hypothetical protein BC833DRAFT_441951 [Globomyces pollinis-pini]|nr:hypothetical protein BC833DRAFT_441951 [Globomyces pollinis-pini]